MISENWETVAGSLGTFRVSPPFPPLILAFTSWYYLQQLLLWCLMVIFYFLLLCLLTRIMQGTFVLFLLFIYLYLHRVLHIHFILWKDIWSSFCLMSPFWMVFLTIVRMFQYRTVKRSNRCPSTWVFLEGLIKALALEARIFGDFKSLVWDWSRNTHQKEFPGGPVVRTRCLHCGGLDSISGWGTKILQGEQQNQKRRKRPQK